MLGIVGSKIIQQKKRIVNFGRPKPNGPVQMNAGTLNGRLALHDASYLSIFHVVPSLERRTPIRIIPRLNRHALDEPEAFASAARYSRLGSFDELDGRLVGNNAVG
jgi:hypothetical protein